MTPTRWNYLVSETQFATELVVSGLSRLCTVPVRGGFWPVAHDQTYPLHVGLHAYTSGLERLSKLTIACHGFATAGVFPALRAYGHKISDLLDAVERLDLSTMPTLHRTPASRPLDDLDPELTEALERFANGAGRYEHLDSLWDDGTDVATLGVWTTLCGRLTPSPRVGYLVAMRAAVLDAIRRLCSEGEFEASGYAMLDPLDRNLDEASSELALRLYQKANWVASALDAVTYYTHHSLPLLGEALLDIQQSPEAFFKYSVALIQDEEITVEELEEHLRRFPEVDDE